MIKPRLIAHIVHITAHGNTRFEKGARKEVHSPMISGVFYKRLDNTSHKSEESSEIMILRTGLNNVSRTLSESSYGSLIGPSGMLQP